MAGNARPTKRIRYSGKTIKLLVGPDEEELIVHEAVLTESSRFFQAAMKNGWKESIDRVIKLPEDNLPTVNGYIAFAYDRQIRQQSAIEAEKWSTSEANREYRYLNELYIFGEKVQDDSFCNTVIAALCGCADEGFIPGDKQVNWVYERTVAGSPIRKLFVHMWVQDGREDWLDGDDKAKPLCWEFLRDLAKGVYRAADLMEKKPYHANRKDFCCRK